MKKKEFLINIAVIVIGYLLLFSSYTINNNIQKGLNMLTVSSFSILLLGLSLSLFGLLIEYKTVIKAIKTGVSINRLKLVLAIILLIVSCLPYNFLAQIIGPISRTIAFMTNSGIIRNVFSILSGILIAKSLLIEKNIN